MNYKVVDYSPPNNLTIVMGRVIEVSKDNQIVFTGNKSMAKYLAKFYNSGGGFNGWTPSFMLNKIKYNFPEDDME